MNKYNRINTNSSLTLDLMWGVATNRSYFRVTVAPTFSVMSNSGFDAIGKLPIELI